MASAPVRGLAQHMAPEGGHRAVGKHNLGGAAHGQGQLLGQEGGFRGGRGMETAGSLQLGPGHLQSHTMPASGLCGGHLSCGPQSPGSTFPHSGPNRRVFRPVLGNDVILPSSSPGPAAVRGAFHPGSRSPSTASVALPGHEAGTQPTPKSHVSALGFHLPVRPGDVCAHMCVSAALPPITPHLPLSGSRWAQPSAPPWARGH